MKKRMSSKHARIRIISFSLLFVGSTLVSWYTLIPFALLYALVWNAYELVVLAFFIDAYFGLAYPFPYYTCGVCLLLIMVQWIKPYLLFYNNQG